MVKHTITLGNEEMDMLLDVVLKSGPAKKRRRIFQIIELAAEAFALVCGIIGHSAIIIILAILLFITTIFTKRIQKWRSRKAMDKMDSRMTGGIREYIVDENGIAIKSEMGDGMNVWTAFTDFGEESHYIWVKRVDQKALIFDRNLMTSQELQELMGYLHKYIKKQDA